MCVDERHRLEHTMAQSRKLVGGDELKTLLLSLCQQLLFQEGRQTPLNGLLILYYMHQNQKNHSEKNA